MTRKSLGRFFWNTLFSFDDEGFNNSFLPFRKILKTNGKSVRSNRKLSHVLSVITYKYHL